MLGIVWSTPSPPSDRLRDAARALEREAERNRDERAAASASATSNRCRSASRRNALATIPEICAERLFACTVRRRGQRSRSPLHGTPSPARAHAAQTRPLRARLRRLPRRAGSALRIVASPIRPLSRVSAATTSLRAAARAPSRARRLVRREEVTVVLEHHEAVAREQPVGRVAVDDVDRAARERLILERRQQRRDRARSDAGAVDLREPGEPVLPLDEVGREAGREMRALACEVAQRAQPIPRRPSSGRTAIANVFWKPSGGSHRMPQRAWKALSTCA